MTGGDFAGKWLATLLACKSNLAGAGASTSK